MNAFAKLATLIVFAATSATAAVPKTESKADAAVKPVAAKCGAGKEVATVSSLDAGTVVYKTSHGNARISLKDPQLGDQKLVVGGKICVDDHAGSV